MSRLRILLLGAVALIVMIILVAAGLLPKTKPAGTQVQNGTAGQSASPQYPSTLSFPGITIPSNAFLPPSSEPGQAFLGGRPAPPPEPPVYRGKTVTTLREVADIIASAPQAPTSANPASLLTLPDVPDSEITVDPSGASTTLDYLTYFNTHAVNGGFAFDYKKFDSVIKDENGVILFTPQLVSNALADNNFAKIHESLSVQKEFARAEIAYIKSIKVAEAVIPLHKENIALEGALITLVDKAFAVEAGALPKSDLQDFFNKFVTTATDAHQALLLQSGALSLNPSTSWFDQLLKDIGFTTPAYAQFKPVFGGRISVPIFCPCSAGFWVIVGPPQPQSLFVPLAVIFNPLLFHMWWQLRPGVWWLGTYLPSVIPCLSAAFCSPIGGGSLYFIGGTSLF